MVNGRNDFNRLVRNSFDTADIKKLLNPKICQSDNKKRWSTLLRMLEFHSCPTHDLREFLLLHAAPLIRELNEMKIARNSL